MIFIIDYYYDSERNYGETNFTSNTTYRSNMLLVMVNQLCQQKIKLDNINNVWKQDRCYGKENNGMIP